MVNPPATAIGHGSLKKPNEATIADAAEILRRGGLVAFPTETVYGLGANALDASAVGKIFRAKGRPANNPLIVHVADAAAARQLTLAWPAAAEQLAAAFWPGPLTLVLPKRPAIPDMVTAGGATVGIRVPAHPVALALLTTATIPLAAPSANRSMQVSPTTAQHVQSGLEGHVELILDAGPTSGGLESTVLDLTVDPPRILRPGLVTVAQLQRVVGPIEANPISTSQPRRSPGLLQRHYAPKATLICCAESSETLIEQLLNDDQRVGWLRLAHQEARSTDFADGRLQIVEMPADAVQYSRRLYATLHDLDDAGVQWIVVDTPPSTDEWLAVRDRLSRASTPNAGP
ncbi:MAG: threonylcarbamoyl-AMP synthase [Pirellulales bacterium]|nr:threonylcarbamoyl-AMP synthase [Pirellulales bacterium]